MNHHRRFVIDNLWDQGRWVSHVGFEVDSSGVICQRELLDTTQLRQGGWQSALRISAACLPMQVNAHSHAFQWGFAGQTEYRTQAQDSFWTWRTQMFRFLEQLTPDAMYDVARSLYQQMLLAGYSHVGEFHYVHVDAQGKPLTPLTVFADAVIQAACDVGMEICILPTLYQQGGFDGRELVSGQRRFYLTQSDFWRMLESLDQRWIGQRGFRSGMALHSLRAVRGEVATQVVREFKRLKPDGVIHIHAAEQTLEVNDCLAATGKRSVQWLLDELGLDPRWSIIHATHLTADECTGLAKSGATVVLCPTTEASLGDGVFSAEAYQAAGGHWAIGGDSHVGVSIPAELRMMEYAQRLATRRRAVLCTDSLSCGEFLYDSTLSGGRRSLGLTRDPLAVGESMNLVVLQPSRLENGAGDEPGRWLDQYLFCEPSKLSVHILHRGQWLDTAPKWELPLNPS